MKIGKVKVTYDKNRKLIPLGVENQFFVVQGDKGWVNPKGEVVKVSADPKHTTFFKDIESAKDAGFTPTAAQAALLKVAASATVLPTK